jgi:DNA-binding response OmpR family regulator
MRTILLVDDDPIILETLRLILRKQGYGVLVGASGSSAETEEQFMNNVVDLVIIDHGFPGDSGSQLAKKLKQRKSVLVLMFSGNPELLERPDFVDLLLPKPTAVPKLLTEIEELFLSNDVRPV